MSNVQPWLLLIAKGHYTFPADEIGILRLLHLHGLGILGFLFGLRALGCSWPSEVSIVAGFSHVCLSGLCSIACRRGDCMEGRGNVLLFLPFCLCCKSVRRGVVGLELVPRGVLEH